MKTIVRMASVFVLGIVAGSMTIPALSAQLRTQTNKRLMTVDLAGFCDGKVVAVDYSEEGQGPTANHYHPGQSFTYILEGSRTVTVAGMPPQTIRAGELHYEAPMRANVSDNASPSKVVTFRILEKGKPESVQVP